MSHLASNLSNIALLYPSIHQWLLSSDFKDPLPSLPELDIYTLRDITNYYSVAFSSPSRFTSARPCSSLPFQYINPKVPLVASLDGNDINLIDHLPIFQYRSQHIDDFTTRHRTLVFLGSQSLIPLVNDFELLSSSVHSQYFTSNNYLPHVRTIVLLEHDVINFVSSLHHFSFSKLIDQCKSLGISFTLLLDSDIEVLRSRLLKHIVADDPSMIYGGLLVKQPRLSPELITLEGWIKSPSGLTEHVNSMLGFDSDEVTQSTHAVWSALSVRPCKLISPLSCSENIPVVLTASGLSLDNSISWLKENCSRLFIWASGSSLATLLRNGITPSIVSVLERDSVIYDLLLELLSEGHDLSSINLLASSTIDPRIPALFNSIIQFHRPASPAYCFFPLESYACLPQGGPQVVNATFEAIVLSGFKKILMLGCDFGSSDRITQRSAQALGVDERDLIIPMSGNFGRTIFSESGLVYSRDLVQNIITQFPELVITRVGDGLVLNGPSNVTLSDLDVSHFSVFPSDITEYFSSLPYTTSSSLQLLDLLNEIDLSLDIFKSRLVSSLNGLSEGWTSSSFSVLTSEISRFRSDLTPSELFIRHHAAHSLFFMLQSLYDWTPSSNVPWSEVVDTTICSVEYIHDFLSLYTSFLRSIISLKQLPEWNVQWLRTLIHNKISLSS